MKRFVRSLRGLHDFIATVVVCAPDRFRERDFRSEGDQLTLERAFAELQAALEFVDARPKDSELNVRLKQLLDESLAAYRSGDEVTGAHLLQDFQDEIFGPQTDIEAKGASNCFGNVA